MATVLEFEGVNKRYRRLFGQEHWALCDFSLQVGPGEIVGFLGPNGAGKTTAIHIALGLAQPTTGSGTLLGKKFGDVAARRKLGFLSESPAYYHQSARDVLRLCGALNGVREPDLSRRASALLESIDLVGEANRNIGKFSRGMLQRIGIAQAFMNDPELLILDEPTSALDPLSRLKVRELLLQARDRGKSVFLSSHQLSEVERICDRVIFVQRGRVIASGRTQEIVQTQDQFEITATGVPHSASITQDVSLENGRWTVTVSAARQRDVIEQIWSAGGTLISVVPKTRTIEEVFFDLMGDSVRQEQKQQ